MICDVEDLFVGFGRMERICAMDLGRVLVSV